MDFSTLRKEYEGYLVYLARKYDYHRPLLNYEDLMAEGEILLWECYNKLEKYEDFHKYFKWSMHNRIIGFLQKELGHKTESLEEIDISDLLTSRENRERIKREYLQRGVEHLKEMLSPISLKITEEIMQPSEELIEMARIQMLRKRHLYLHQNKSTTRGWKKICLTKDLVRKYLGISQRQFQKALSEIKEKMEELELHREYQRGYSL